MYKTVNDYYKEKFGSKVYKLSVDGGFICPNRDEKIDTRGCIFCSALGSGEFAERGGDILSQLEKAKSRVEAKNKSGKYIAYFQSFTNTYAPISRPRHRLRHRRQRGVWHHLLDNNVILTQKA